VSARGRETATCLSQYQSCAEKPIPRPLCPPIPAPAPIRLLRWTLLPHRPRQSPHDALQCKVFHRLILDFLPASRTCIHWGLTESRCAILRDLRVYLEAEVVVVWVGAGLNSKVSEMLGEGWVENVIRVICHVLGESRREPVGETALAEYMSAFGKATKSWFQLKRRVNSMKRTNIYGVHIFVVQISQQRLSSNCDGSLFKTQ
jgi:hypothetical protein